MSSDLTQTGTTLVYDLINSANPGLQNGPLSTSNTTLGAPTATGATPNTALEITAVAGKGYTGNDTVNYNRIDIGAMFTAWAVTATVSNGASYTNASDLLPTLNSQYGLNLQVSDIVEGAIGASSYPFTYTLVMAADSLTYIGSLAVTLDA
jgi:hypothetical protein